MLVFFVDLVAFLTETSFFALETFLVTFFDEFVLEFLDEVTFVEFFYEALDLVIDLVAFFEETTFTGFDAPFVAVFVEFTFFGLETFLLEIFLLDFSDLVVFLLTAIFFG